MRLTVKWICGLILTAAIAVPSLAQVSLYIGGAPPPMRYERRGEAPGPGYAWVDGYWEPNGRHYRWVQGRWDQPPYEGAYWNHPHYDHYQRGWQMHEGHWDHEDHDNGHGRDHEGQDRGEHDRGEHDRGRGHDEHNRQ